MWSRVHPHHDSQCGERLAQVTKYDMHTFKMVYKGSKDMSARTMGIEVMSVHNSSSVIAGAEAGSCRYANEVSQVRKQMILLHFRQHAMARTIPDLN